MNPILAAAAEVDDLCQHLGLSYCFIGGLAVLRWGEPRLTRDVDLTVITEFGTEEQVVDALLDRYTRDLLPALHRGMIVLADRSTSESSGRAGVGGDGAGNVRASLVATCWGFRRR